MEDRTGPARPPEGNDAPMNTTTAQDLREGDIVEFTLKGERRTAEIMLVTMDDVILLDLFDGDRPAWARLAQLEDVAIYRPEMAEIFAAA